MTLRPFGPALTAAVAASLLVSAPAFAKKHEAAAQASNSSDPVVANVNGDLIHKSDVEAALKQIMPPGKTLSLSDPQVFDKVRNDLILNKLAYQEAIKEGMQNSAEVKRAEAMAHQQIVTSAFFNKIATPAVTDDKVKAAYDEVVKTQPKQDEIHARHILVKTEDEAKDVIKQLDAGTDFEKLAKDKGVPEGGDLGYFTKNGTMDPAFLDAAFALQPNTYTKTPVKTSFGWDVVQVLDKRPAKTPTLEEAKPQLRSQMAQRAVQARVNELVKGSKVQFYNVDGSPESAPQATAPAQPVATPAAPAPATPPTVAAPAPAGAAPLQIPGAIPAQ